MKNKHFDYFDNEEKELIESVERGEWKTVDNLQYEIEKAEKAAKATFAKSERINIRLSKRELNILKIKAIEDGIPYQHLASGIIHKYLAGRLIEH